MLPKFHEKVWGFKYISSMVDGVIYFPKEQKEKGNYLNDLHHVYSP